MITLSGKNTAVLQPSGQLDLQTGVTLVQALGKICPHQYDRWVIDMSHVDFIDSAGLTALINGLNLAAENQCCLAVHNLHPAVKLVFEITRMDEIFEVVDTIDIHKDVIADLDRTGDGGIAHAA